ncbi:MAG: transketolase family protein [Sporomusaceae bacterium]|jgi:transketolase|nr:transketolase family protein [Sporomusaceae bacterium]
MIAIRDAFGEALRELGGKNKDVVALDADLASSTKSGLFGAEYPERFFNVGIAEANMFAMAAGLAIKGKIPFANTFAAFAILRAGDPIRSLIAYQKLNVKICGAYTGFSDSYDGASHHATADIAFMRALPNMTIIAPADPLEARLVVKAAAKYQGPVYLRLSRAPVPDIFDASYKFKMGKGVKLTEGDDVSLIATGYMVYKSLEAAKLLKNRGINARVINLHTIKPLDKSIILACAQETKAVITVEEHNIYGGLGSAVAEVLAESGAAVKMKRIGVNDVFAESGDYEKLLEKYGLSVQNIYKTALSCYNSAK